MRRIPALFDQIWKFLTMLFIFFLMGDEETRQMQLSRPPELFALFAQTGTLPGVGTKMSELLEKRAGKLVIDLLRLAPVGLIDRSARPSLPDAQDGQIASFEVIVLAADIPPARSRRPARIRCGNEAGEIELIFFRSQPDWLKTALPVGEKRLISGRVERYQGTLQMPHPDYILPLLKKHEMPEIETVYPMTAGLRAKPLRRAIEAGLKKLPYLPEWIDETLLAERGWPSFTAAMHALHHPVGLAELDPNAPVRQRLAYDELLANQLALGLLRASGKRDDPGRQFAGDRHLQDQLIAALPWPLTGAQQRVAGEIAADQAAAERMLRLLQGDVGSGKTLVALLAMLNVAECGSQAALLAPTEILARQHHASFQALLDPLGLESALLLGGAKSKERQQVLDRLASGEIQIIIGTHALLSEAVQFADLGLAVIDEQHRFGVRQRLLLSEKGRGCDILVMTATPIPRSLAMTAYGDLKASQLDEKPPGRQEVETALVNLERMEAIIGRLRVALEAGQRAYWICPLVEETDKSDIAAAEDRHRLLTKILPEAKPALVHGRMLSEARQTEMEKFRSGEASLLVATTVIEVGVDVPEASIIIIEHAERFGLAQLHQLRGRVGRGAARSSCLLLWQEPLSETASARLKIMRASNDGFVIAEEDLKLRGPGEVLGQRQSGIPEFQLADLAAHADLLARARQEAETVLHRWPDLAAAEAACYRMLLSLFEKDRAVRYLGAG